METEISKALAALRANPLDESMYPRPWRKDGFVLVDADGNAVSAARAHIAATVNSAPVLAAEVERSHGNLLTQAKRAGLPVEQLQATDLAEHLADRVLELEAQLAAARVAVEKVGMLEARYTDPNDLYAFTLKCAQELRTTKLELRRSVGLEESHG